MSHYFEQFLSNIEPTQKQLDALQKSHEDVRAKLQADPRTKPLVDTVFLQGSYKRATLVLAEGDEKPDIDVVLVTTIDEQKCGPQEAHDEFKPFLDDNYPGWKQNHRSMAIPGNLVKLDMVPTAAPDRINQERIAKAFSNNRETLASASYEQLLQKMDQELKAVSAAAATKDPPSNWRDHPLRIPDRDVKTWESTNPLAQIEWTRAKNRRCSGQYIRVVKAIKWWRKVTPGMPLYPKGYPLEHLVGECCPDKGGTMEELVAATFGTMYARYRRDAEEGRVPVLNDHGVISHDVMKRIKPDQFRAFHAHVRDAAAIASQAAACEDPDEAAFLWHRLFGDKFPRPSGGHRTRPPPAPPAFPPPKAPASPPPQRFAR